VETGLLGLIAETGIPTVGITCEPDYGVPGVYPDMGSFLDQACELLARRGRTRVAVLGMDHKAGFVAALQDAASRHGLGLRPEWTHEFHRNLPEAAANVIRLLISLPEPARPNGLLVTDDNLTEHVADGLRAAPLSAPEDVLVISHANFPSRKPDGIRLERIGFDTGEILARCLTLLDTQRAGRGVPCQTLVEAIHERHFAAPEPLHDKAVKEPAEMGQPAQTPHTGEGDTR
jgi:DNA-binding LacI/PurR family transcriptional regulator